MARSSTWSCYKIVKFAVYQACATDIPKLLVEPVCKTAPKSLLWVPPVYQDLSTCHDWSIRKAIVYLPIRLQRNLKHISANLLRQLGARNKDVIAALQVLLTRVRFCQCDAGYCSSG